MTVISAPDTTAHHPAPPEFGAHAPTGLVKTLITMCRNAPPKGPGRWAVSPLKRLILAASRGPVDVETYGANMRLHPHDNLADKRVLLQPDVFDVMERAALSDIMHDRFAFIDAGANTGMYSLFVAAKAGRAAHILAIEPQPVIKDRLAFNIAANGYVQITHADIALADGEGEAQLVVSPANRGATRMASGGPSSEGDTIRVPTIGLFELMDYQGMARADALKIDIEGAEDQVMPGFFERCPPDRLPRMIIMETLSKTWTVDCVQLAKDRGYGVERQNPRNIVLTRP